MDINDNLIKLSELMRKQTIKSFYNPSKYSNLQLMLARSVSISTQSSSRNLNSKKNSYFTNKQQITESLKQINTKDISLAKKLRQCNSYIKIHKVNTEFNNSDGYCGLKKVLKICSNRSQ